MYRAVTRARACVVRRSNVLECVSTMTRMFCYMHAGLLDGRCLGRHYRVSVEQLGALKSLRRLCLPEVGLLHLHLYNVLTDDACADAL